MRSSSNSLQTDAIAKTSEGKIDYTQDFFKRPAFLTVSGQLNAEIYACSMGSVYTFGPTFRAEDSHTSRHLAEFWMIEPGMSRMRTCATWLTLFLEIAFADLFENMDVAEGYVKFTLKYAMEACPQEFIFLEEYEKTALLEKKKEAAAALKKEEEERKAKGEAPQKKKKCKSSFLEFRLQLSPFTLHSDPSSRLTLSSFALHSSPFVLRSSPPFTLRP